MSKNDIIFGLRTSPPAKPPVLRCHTSDMTLHLNAILSETKKTLEGKFCYFDTLKNLCDNISKGRNHKNG